MLDHHHQQLALRDDRDSDETACFVVPGRVGFEVGETDLLGITHLPEQLGQMGVTVRAIDQISQVVGAMRHRIKHLAVRRNQQ